MRSNNFRDAERLSQRVKELADTAQRTGDRYMEAFNEYDRLGCGNSPSFVGT